MNTARTMTTPTQIPAELHRDAADLHRRTSFQKADHLLRWSENPQSTYKHTKTSFSSSQASI
ncbi:hypothetical protein CCACVL1_24779 [Corchorus capsularis]|uniref:Uncharacterized protein n=1 Tax=Corchorus capsularis TaxID=210143 RepID=A0A1R3GN74_COCAP|nr:hypothetical protein CCACVL1_24779 [Corchorus capsularis]